MVRKPSTYRAKNQLLKFQGVQESCTIFTRSSFHIAVCTQWRIFHGFHGTPLLKGCLLRKYYAQTFYVHYVHTGATHFSFNSSNNARASTPVSRIRRAHGLRARVWYQKHVATIETMSKVSERIKACSCIVPSAQLGMARGDMLSV